jgi:hypothetical protein
MTDPLSLADLDALDRLARAHIEAEALADAYAQREGPDFDSREYQRVCKAAVAARVALADFATALRVAQLVAAARRYHELRRLLFEDMEEVERLRCLSPSRVDAYLSVPKLTAARAGRPPEAPHG